MTRGDKLLIGGVLTLTVMFWGVSYLINKNNSLTGLAVIRSSGRIVEEIELGADQSRIYEIEGPLGTSLAKVTGVRVQMLSSPCRDKICIKQGPISERGQSIVCAPNKVSITIEKKGEIDEITR